MIQDEYNFLIEKLIDNDITEKQLCRLEELASQNPEFKKEYDQYSSVIQGIKNEGVREELKDIMDTEKPDESDGV